MDRAYYCFDHNIQFDTLELYIEHQGECDQLLKEFNVCTQHGDGGGMCGMNFANTTALYEHIRSRHNVYICVQCEYQTTQIDDLEHEHIMTSQCRAVYNCEYVEEL